MNGAEELEHTRSSSEREVERFQSELGERLSYVRKDILGASLPLLAQQLGIGRSSVMRYERGDRIPDAWFLFRISQLSGISLDWLVTGKGPMRPGGTDEGAEEFKEEFVLVPLYDVEVSAGHGSTVEQEKVSSQLAFRRDWLTKTGLSPSNLVSLTARGDSMEPTIRHGDLLLIDTSQRNVVEDGIYVIRVDNHLLAKRLQRRLDGTIVVKGDNPAYERQEIPPGEAQHLHVVGRVVWSGRQM